MKRLFTSLLLMIIVITANAASAAAPSYTTPGDGKTYTFEMLSTLTTEVEKKADNIFLVKTPIAIAKGDELKLLSGEQILLADGVQIYIYGRADFTPESSAIITRATDTAAPFGVYIYEKTASGEFRNVVFEYGALRLYCESGTTIENCTFRKINQKLSKSAITFALSNGGNIVRNCKFIECELSAVGGASNVATGVIFENNFLYKNTTANRNYPQINLTVGGNNDVIVRNNTVIGNTANTLVGGICVANLLGLGGTNNCIIEGNTVSDCRYGINTQGPMTVSIRNNSLMNNHYEKTPANGGSGISINNVTSAKASGNFIEGSLWGVTIIGKPGDINFGKTDDPSASDYNPGNNVFFNNGNDGSAYATSTEYDMYNNTTTDLTVYAQGNLWGTAMQDSEHISSVVWDSHDDGAHGEIIFATSTPTEIIEITNATESQMKVSGNAIITSQPSQLAIYTVGGMLVRNSETAIQHSLEGLASGTYVAIDKLTHAAVKFAK